MKNLVDKIKNGDIPKIDQDLSKGNLHYSYEIDSASKIDLNKFYKARDLLNLIRARTFTPYPGAWFVENEKKYEIRINIKENKED